MAGRTPSDVSLSPDLARLIADAVATGDYADADAVVRAGLRALRPDLTGWPAGGGECGALIRERDWRRTPLGPVGRWSHEMRATVSNLVNSPVAKVLMWGPDHILFYNDAYRAIAGERHPLALGRGVAEAFPDLWDWNRDVLAAVLRGETRSFLDQPIVFRHATGPETRMLGLFYTPVYDADGLPGGVLCTIIDNSARVAAERRLAASEAELRRITDAVPMLVSYVDRDHVYRFANADYEQWFGIAPDAIVGRHVRDVLGEEAYATRAGDLSAALGGRSIVAETVLPTTGWARVPPKSAMSRTSPTMARRWASMSSASTPPNVPSARRHSPPATAASAPRWRRCTACCGPTAPTGGCWANSPAGRR